MSNIGGQRRTLLQAVKHVYTLGGMRAYYRGLAVSSRSNSQCSRGLITRVLDRFNWRVPVLCNRYEHLRGVEAGLRTVNEAGRTWCSGSARFRKRFWERRCDERVPAEPGSDDTASFWISCPPTTLYGNVGRSLTDVQPERRSWVLRRSRTDTGEGYPGGFNILCCL